MNKIAVVSLMAFACCLLAPATCPADGMPPGVAPHGVEALQGNAAVPEAGEAVEDMEGEEMEAGELEVEDMGAEEFGPEEEQAEGAQPVIVAPPRPAPEVESTRVQPAEAQPPVVVAPPAASPAPATEPEVRVVRPEQPQAAPQPAQAAPAAPAAPEPVEEAPPAAAAPAPAASPARACPPPTAAKDEAGRDAGPYWKEKELEPRPFINPQASYPEKALRKFGRGLANIVTAPVELVNQPLNYAYRTENQGVISSLTALVVGVPAGVGWLVYRAVTGVVDVVTFPAPFFEPLIEPEFVMNDAQKRHVLQIKDRQEMEERFEKVGGPTPQQGRPAPSTD